MSGKKWIYGGDMVVEENPLEKGTVLQAVRDGNISWYRRIDENVFERIIRLLELLPDEDALAQLDKAIKILEEPKREITKHIVDELTSTTDLPKFLQEALMALPMEQLKEMEEKVSELKMHREPGGDCLIIAYGGKVQRINL